MSTTSGGGGMDRNLNGPGKKPSKDWLGLNGVQPNTPRPPAGKPPKAKGGRRGK